MTGPGGLADRSSSWAWILVLQLALVLPFVGQPIQLDDSLFVDIGRNVLNTPWHPHDFSYCFLGECTPDMASHSHPPFLSYWIGLLLWVFGDGPRVHVTLHLGFLIFPMLFAYGMFRLARRFSGSPRLATALAVASPAAVVLSHNLMADYATLAFWTIALALYVDGVDGQKPFLVWIAGVFLALAAFSSYPAVLAAGVCWIYAWLKGSRMRAALLAPLIAIVWMGAWLAYSSIYFGRFVIGGTAQYFLQSEGSLTAARVADKILALPILLAATLIFPVPLVRAGLGWLKGLAAILWPLISILLAQMYAAEYALPERFLVVLFLTAGGWIILGLLLRIWRSCAENGSPEVRQDALFLGAWAAVVTFAAVFVYSAASARYGLPLLPPLVLLAFPIYPVVTKSSLRWSAVLGLSAAALLGLCLSTANFEMARVHRDIAQYMGTKFKGWENQVRFGGEWGFRHYMLEQGFRQFISTSADLAGGEFVVTPRQAAPYTVPQDAQSMLVPVRQMDWQSPIPIRVMSRESHAGLYSSFWGLLPFSFSRVPVEEVTVQQVSYLIDKLPEITLESASKQEILLPRPAPDGGLDLVVPVPARLTIPYDGPSPARIQFSCNECAMRVFYSRDGVQSEVEVRPSPDLSMFFELHDSSPGTIVLEIGPVGTSSDAGHASIRNWLVLPLGGAP